MRPTPLQEIADAPAEAYRELLLPAGWFVLGFLVLYLVGRLLVEPAIAGVVRRRNRNNPTIQDAIERYLHLVTVLLATAAGIVVAGFGHVLTGSALVIAAATLAIGVAGQELLGALLSGLFLVSDPNFSVGDWIVWDDREGVVEAIAFRTTRVRTPQNEIVTVPNTELTSSAIVRPYGRETFRVTEEFGIDFDDDVETALSILREAAASRTVVVDDPAPDVYLREFGGDAVILRVDYWIRNPTRRTLLRARSAVDREIKARFDAAGLTISPPSGRDLSGQVRFDHPRPEEAG